MRFSTFSLGMVAVLSVFVAAIPTQETANNTIQVRVDGKSHKFDLESSQPGNPQHGSETSESKKGSPSKDY